MKQKLFMIWLVGSLVIGVGVAIAESVGGGDDATNLSYETPRQNSSSADARVRRAITLTIVDTHACGRGAGTIPEEGQKILDLIEIFEPGVLDAVPVSRQAQILIEECNLLCVRAKDIGEDEETYCPQRS